MQQDTHDRKGRPLVGVRPRTLVVAIVVIVLVAAVLIALMLLLRRTPESREAFPQPPGSVRFIAEFPGSGRRLRNPKGLAEHEERLYVAESDSSRIRVFELDGIEKAPISVPSLSGRPSYPVDITSFADRLVVVDGSLPGLVFLRVDGSTGKDEVGQTLARALLEGTPPKSPTAVTSDGLELYVADSEDRDIKVYDTKGKLRRRIGLDLNPRLTYVSGMSLTHDKLYASDSNAGRVVVFDRETGVEVDILQHKFRLPRGVFATNEKVLVVDVFEKSLEVFNSGGEPTEHIRGSEDVGDGRAKGLPSGFERPQDVTYIAGRATAYVSDAGDGKIKVLKLSVR